MTEVIGVRFRNPGKLYYFAPQGREFTEGEGVVVDTSQGQRYGLCAMKNHEVEDHRVLQPLRPALRPATTEDAERWDALQEKARLAIPLCKTKIAEHSLSMKLISAEYTLDESKLIFCFTADGRVDFRELVRDLAGLFRIRIELRQVGVRDETRMLGGLGRCGRPFCCETFLESFQTVSIKMAKDQNLSINPAKISGTCGRLQCCLKYEQEAYEDLARRTPALDSIVETPMGRGRVTDVHLLSGRLRVMLDNPPEPGQKIFHKSDVTPVGADGQASGQPAGQSAAPSSGGREGRSGGRDNRRRSEPRKNPASDSRPAAQAQSTQAPPAQAPSAETKPAAQPGKSAGLPVREFRAGKEPGGRETQKPNAALSNAAPPNARSADAAEGTVVADSAAANGVTPNKPSGSRRGGRRRRR